MRAQDVLDWILLLDVSPHLWSFSNWKAATSKCDHDIFKTSPQNKKHQKEALHNPSAEDANGAFFFRHLHLPVLKLYAWYTLRWRDAEGLTIHRPKQETSHQNHQNSEAMPRRHGEILEGPPKGDWVAA